MNKCVRTKSRTGRKFSKIFFQQLHTELNVVVHYDAVFLCGVRWRHNSAKFRTAFLLRDQMYFVSHY